MVSFKKEEKKIGERFNLIGEGSSVRNIKLEVFYFKFVINYISNISLKKLRNIILNGQIVTEGQNSS